MNSNLDEWLEELDEIEEIEELDNSLDEWVDTDPPIDILEGEEDYE